ncbi:MAG: DUF4124 domain-containing protein [Methylococcaceae bacterium]
MKFILLVAAGLFPVYASATVYKCVNASGKIDYQHTPCAEGNNNAQINLKTGSSIDLDEEKAQAQLKEKAEQAKLEQQKLEEQKLAEQQAQLKQETAIESEKNQLLIKNNPEKFSAYAIPPYQVEKLSALVKAYQKRLPEIERLRGAAAEKALATEQCGRVEASELNERSAQDALVFLVDCSSGKAMYFTEQELAK